MKTEGSHTGPWLEEASEKCSLQFQRDFEANVNKLTPDDLLPIDLEKLSCVYLSKRRLTICGFFFFFDLVL